MNRLGFLGACAAMMAVLGLASCSDGEDAAEEADPAAQASGAAPSWSDPEAPAGITVTNARMTLPAVSGNPGAVYFTINNAGDADQAIASAWVAGAGSAMLHETVSAGNRAGMRQHAAVPLPGGESVAFAPGGLHVMAMEVGDTLEEGGETEVTLTFASGDKISFPAAIVGPGGGEDTAN